MCNRHTYTQMNRKSIFRGHRLCRKEETTKKKSYPQRDKRKCCTHEIRTGCSKKNIHKAKQLLEINRESDQRNKSPTEELDDKLEEISQSRTKERDEDGEQLEVSNTAGGDEKRYIHFEKNSLAAPYKVNHTLNT